MPTLVFAADTLVRFKAGRILIHTTSSPMPAFETENPMLIGWLCQFSKPTASEAMVAKIDPRDRQIVQEVLDYLQRNGALVQSQTAEAEPLDEMVLMSRITSHLRLLTRSTYDIANDILAFGPFAELELSRRTSAGVERRLLGLLSAVDGFRSELTALRAPFIERQLKALPREDVSAMRRLHIGCGKGLLSGWINIDVYPAPLSQSVLWGLPFADDSVEFVFVSHMLEHLFYPRDVKQFLNEIRRVLCPGGVLRVVVPDVEQCIEAYAKNDANFFASRRETWPWWPENPTRLEDFLAYSGVGPEPAYLFESHKYGYDYETLQRILSEAGLVDVVRSEYMQSSHADLRVDHISAVAGAQYGSRYYSLFVEARRPG